MFLGTVTIAAPLKFPCLKLSKLPELILRHSKLQNRKKSWWLHFLKKLLANLSQQQSPTPEGYFPQRLCEIKIKSSILGESCKVQANRQPHPKLFILLFKIQNA